MSVINTLCAKFISVNTSRSVIGWLQLWLFLTALLPSVVKKAKWQLTRVNRCRSKPPSFPPGRLRCHGAISNCDTADSTNDLKIRPDQTYFLLPSLTICCDVLPLLTAPSQQGPFVWAWKRPVTFLNLRSSSWNLVGFYPFGFRPCHSFPARLDHRLIPHSMKERGGVSAQIIYISVHTGCEV
jgi:hypothetical protein